MVPDSIYRTGSDKVGKVKCNLVAITSFTHAPPARSVEETSALIGLNDGVFTAATETCSNFHTSKGHPLNTSVDLSGPLAPNIPGH